MLQILIQAIVIGFVSIETGIGVSKLMRVEFNNPVKTIFLGLFAVAIIGRIWHFGAPLDIYFLIVLLLLSFLCLFVFSSAQWPFFNKLSLFFSGHKGILIGFIISSFVLLFFSSLTSISYDEGLYHAGYIKWLNLYPEVRGLANVEGRLGFNSNWHLLSSIFNGYGLWSVPANCINLCLLLLMLLYFLWESKSNVHFRVAIVFLFFPLLLIYHFIDPSADLVVVLFSLAFLLELFFYRNRENPDDLFWFFVLPFLATVKINSVVLLPALLYFMFISLRANPSFFVKNAGRVAVYSLLLIIPWVISNLVISGYLIYPYLGSPFGPYAWTVPHDTAAAEIDKIKYTPLVRWSGITFTEAASMGKIAQLSLWWRSVRPVEKTIVCFFVISAILLIVKAISKKEKPVISIIMAGLLFLSIALVPDYRFFAGMGFAIVVGVFSFYGRLHSWLVHKNILSFLVSFQLLISLALYQYLYPKVFQGIAPGMMVSVIEKQPYQYGNYIVLKKTGTAFYHPTDNEFCWDRIPCTLQQYNHLKLLGKTVDEGFCTIPPGIGRK